MGDLKRSLTDAVRRMAFNTSVDQLKKRGVEKVNVLGIDRIVRLIEQAVHKSLKNRLLAADRAAVADATTEEFVRLLKSNEDLRRSRDELAERQARAEEETNEMRLELQRLRQELEQRLDAAQVEQRARYEGENAEISERVRLLFEAGGQMPSSDQVLAIVMDLVDSERRTAVTALEAARNREVDQLQRRIAKLNRSLEVTEERLSQVAAMKDVDGGIASIYREVQGLNGGDSHASRKRELMADIFKANMALQKKG